MEKHSNSEACSKSCEVDDNNGKVQSVSSKTNASKNYCPYMNIQKENSYRTRYFVSSRSKQQSSSEKNTNKLCSPHSAPVAGFQNNKRFNHNHRDHPRQKIQCRFFKSGFCRSGTNCQYLHLNKAENSVFEDESSSESKEVYSQTDVPKNKPSYNRNVPLCYYFKRGVCRNGDRCKFYHQKRNESHKKATTNKKVQLETASLKSETETELLDTDTKTELLDDETKTELLDAKMETLSLNNTNYVNETSVSFKDKDENGKLEVKNDKLSSDNKDTTNTGSESNESKCSEATLKNVNAAVRKVPVLPFVKHNNMYDLFSLTEDDLSKFRNTEIKQLKLRFPNHNTLEENTFTIVFEPSDPDWAFDVRNLSMKVNFPPDYPIELCQIEVMNDNENLPPLLIQFLNESIQEFLNKRCNDNKASGKVELVFRPFLKWFDRNLENLFICGLRKVKQVIKAKEDGIDFVPFDKIFVPRKNSGSTDAADDDHETHDAEPKDVADASHKMAAESKQFENESTKTNLVKSNFNASDSMKVLLSNLQLIEGIAALACTKISSTMQCRRCRTSCNMVSSAKRGAIQKCSKCSKDIGFTLEPSTVHQFSNVLGVLYLVDCKPIDVNLVECHFLVDCLNCSKQVTMDGIHYGQQHKTWCMFCHQKLVLSVDSIKFLATSTTSSVAIKATPGKENVVKKAKDPVVKEGSPLPDCGACKHYKKSYRWLRFPCCGRLYPCDVCHDEKETDHEMKYASRMICGFCSKEQPYSSDKPCILCSKSMTKKSGSHWEGGKGCRNKSQMSREDKHKYVGVSKTVSRKAQATKSGKK